jgi:hypothetical protein
MLKETETRIRDVNLICLTGSSFNDQPGVERHSYSICIEAKSSRAIQVIFPIIMLFVSIWIAANPLGPITRIPSMCHGRIPTPGFATIQTYNPCNTLESDV